jgi:hypothetical protein
MACCYFCDDIRYEVGNKYSMTGVYSSSLIVLDAPTVLPKLCCVISCYTGLDQPFQSLSFRVKGDGSIVSTMDHPESEMEIMHQRAQEFAARAKEGIPQQNYRLSANLVIGKYPVTSTHTVTVTAIADGEEMLAGRLWINLKEQGA